MKLSNTTISRQRMEAQKDKMRRELWLSVHKPRSVPALPINHPIPRLTPPLRTRCSLERIEAFVRSRATALAMACIAVALTSGCTVVSYRGASGERFSRMALGTSAALSSLEVDSGTNGLRRISLSGYRSDSTDALRTVTEAAVRTALTGK